MATVNYFTAQQLGLGDNFIYDCESVVLMIKFKKLDFELFIFSYFYIPHIVTNVALSV